MLRFSLILSLSILVSTPTFSQLMNESPLDSLIRVTFVELNDFTYNQGPFKGKSGKKFVSFYDPKLGFFLNYVSHKFEIDLSAAGYMGAYVLSKENIKELELIVKDNVDQISLSEIQSVYFFYSKIISLYHYPSSTSLDSIQYYQNYYSSKIDSLLKDD